MKVWPGVLFSMHPYRHTPEPGGLREHEEVFQPHSSFNDLIAWTLSIFAIPDVEPAWPIEMFAQELRLIGSGVELLDFRDMDVWPRARGPGFVEPEGRDPKTGKILKYGRMVYGPHDKAYDPKIYGYPDKSRGLPKAIIRAWSGVTTLMAHSAGVLIPGERFLGIPSQWGISYEGSNVLPKAVLQHSALAYCQHGDDANRFTVGLEIAGAHDWAHPAQRAIAYAFLRLFKRMRQAACGPNAPYYLMPHRFSKGKGSIRKKGRDNKSNDPGAPIWNQLWAYAQDIGYQLGPVLSRGLALPFPERTPAFSESDHAQYECAV